MHLVDALRRDPEPSFPEWLKRPSPRFNRNEFFNSRTVYYPGSGCDGHPVSLCARSHATQSFVYVDYGVSREAVVAEIEGVCGFRDSGAIPDLGGIHRHPRRLLLREDSSVWQRLNC